MNGTLTITTNNPDIQKQQAASSLGLTNQYNTFVNYREDDIHLSVDALIQQHQLNRLSIRSVIFTASEADASPIIITRYVTT